MRCFLPGMPCPSTTQKYMHLEGWDEQEPRATHISGGGQKAQRKSNQTYHSLVFSLSPSPPARLTVPANSKVCPRKADFCADANSAPAPSQSWERHPTKSRLCRPVFQLSSNPTVTEATRRAVQLAHSAIRCVPTAHSSQGLKAICPCWPPPLGSWVAAAGCIAQGTFLPSRQPIQAQLGASSCFLLTNHSYPHPTAVSSGLCARALGVEGQPNPTVSETKESSLASPEFGHGRSLVGLLLWPAAGGSWRKGRHLAPGGGHEAPGQRAPGCVVLRTQQTRSPRGLCLPSTRPPVLRRGGFGPWISNS